jgi:hypothetical protein
MRREKLLQDALFDIKIEYKNRKPVFKTIKAKNVTFDQAKAYFEEANNLFKDDALWIKSYDNIMDDFGFVGICHGDLDIDCSAHAKVYFEKTKDPLHTCPRRAEGPLYKFDLEDNWNKIGVDRVCSFCGSMHPEDVLQLMRDGGVDRIQNTTKSYKFYIDRPEVPNAGFGAIKFYSMHFNAEQREEYNKLIKEYNASILNKKEDNRNY